MLKKIFLPLCLSLSGCTPSPSIGPDYPEQMIRIMTEIQNEIAKAKEKNGPPLNLCVLFRTSAHPPSKTSEVLIFQISREGAAWIPPKYSRLELAGAKALGAGQLTTEEIDKIKSGMPVMRCGAVGFITPLQTPGKTI